MKYQLMVDFKDSNNMRLAPCCHFGKSIEPENFFAEVKEYDKLLEQGVRLTECSKCWEMEDKGLTSVRTGELEWEPGDDPYFHKNGIRKLDIRIHNKCNLACTMCYSGASNLWGKLEGKDTFNKISDADLDYIRQVIKENDIIKISFQGGEPFYGDDYDDFLMSLPKLKKIEVDVFTNVISVKQSVIERWHNSLRNVIINASVDGHGDVYESIRWPTTWKKFEKNAITIYNTIRSDSMTYYWVVQAENLCNMFDFIRWRDENTPTARIEFSILSDSFNRHLGLDYITPEEKVEFLRLFDEYSKKDYSTYYTREINYLKRLRKVVRNIIPDDKLINLRKKEMERVQTLRKNYRTINNVEDDKKGLV